MQLDGVQRDAQNNPTGWTILMLHLNHAHADAVQLIQTNPPEAANSIIRFFQPKRGKNMFGWLELVVLGLRPFNFVEDEIIRKYVKLEPICVNTFKQHMLNLTRHVEMKIAKELPKVFCLVFDGWSCGDTHYVGLFATFPAENNIGYRKALLSFSPMGMN